MPKNSKKSVIVTTMPNGMRTIKGMTSGMRKVSTAEADKKKNINTAIMNQTAKYIKHKIEIEIEKLD